jgi:hypothetical protein
MSLVERAVGGDLAAADLIDQLGVTRTWDFRRDGCH